MIPRRLAFVIAALVWTSAAIPHSRAETNLELLLSGRKQFAQLNPTERDEVVEVIRRLRATPVTRETESLRCWRQELGRNSDPSELAARLIELRCGRRDDREAPHRGGE